MAGSVGMVTSFARERPLVQLEDRHCEHSEAIQLCCREEGKLDCFVASAPRNDAKAQLLVLAARKRPGYAKNLVPLKRGRRECRALDAPDSRVCNGSGRTHTRCQVTPESPGIPHAMAYGLYRALPGARALWPPSSAKVALRELDTSVGASGPRDFAVRIGRPRQKHRPRPPHPAPRS